MKTGRDPKALLQELVRKEEVKRDFQVKTEALKMDLIEHHGTNLETGQATRSFEPRLQLHDDRDRGPVIVDEFGIKEHAHGQLAGYLKIPKAYYDRMRDDAPFLLKSSVNTWLDQKDDQRFVRTLDGDARALLSPGYRPLDYVDFMQATLPILAEKNASIVSNEVTDKKLYLKAVTPRLQSKVVNDVVQAGVALSDSEVGAGGVDVAILLYTVWCTNGAVIEKAFKRYHIGRRHEVEDMMVEVMSERSQALSDAAVWSMVQDAVRAAFDEKVFNQVVDKLNGIHENKIESPDVPKVVEVARKKLLLPESSQTPILTHLLQGGDLSQYGLFNAVTRASQDDFASYELASEMEVAGGRIMELPKSDWQEIAQAV